MTGNFKMDMNLKGLENLQRKSPKAFTKAMEIGAIQFLTWTANGSAKESKKPPIKTGFLRASGSAFVGSKLVKVNPQTYSVNEGSESKPEPARSLNAPKDVITIVYNTDYAAKMHEHTGGWGHFTEQDGDAGNKWLEDHIKSDKDDLMKVIAKEIGRNLRL